MSIHAKFRTILVAGAAVIGIASVGEAKEFKVGLLTNGMATENGWNKVAYNALQRIKSDLGATVSNVELDSNPASYEKVFLDYASQGYRIVIGHGFEFQDAAKNVAADYPETMFLITATDGFKDNLVGVNLSNEQPFFALGVIAGRMTDKAGYIGGMEIPPIKQGEAGFKAGGRSVNPNFKVSTVYIGNFTDAGAAKEAAIAMIADGAKVIVPNSDSAALGAMQAVKEAGDGVSAFGVFGDFTSAAPNNVLVNYQPDLGAGLVGIAKQIQDGTFKPTGPIVFTFQNPDVIRLFYNDKAKHPVSAALRDEVMAVKTKLGSGEIVVK